jgi:thiol-disulfide isomerase/thioredoxin
MSSESYFLKSKFVKELTPRDFDQIATWKLLNKKCSIVLFYANWCPHCKALIGVWEDLAKKAAFMEVVAFDCANHEAHMGKIKEDMPELVKGYPTIMFYSEGSPTEQYKGERDIKNLLKACMSSCKA